MANKVEIQIVGNNVYAVNAIDGVKTKLGTLDMAAKRTNSMISNLGGTLVGAFSIYAIANYGAQLLDVGNKVRGVENAFERIDQGNYLEALRIATNGLIGDLELMQAATFAEKFKIPFNVLVKGMEFAQLTAIETGQSFEYMMDSFVRGTARESEKILDNLGISAKVLREEIKRTGDFMTALENIMDSELNKMRGSLDETILKSRKFSTEMANAWDKIGVATSYAFNWLTEYGNKLSLGFIVAEELAKRQAESNKLIGQRYDVLATTFNLEKEALPQMVLLTETQKKALALAQKHREEEEKKLEALRKQNEQNQLALTIMSNKNRLPSRGLEDYGTGVDLIPAPSIDMTAFLASIELQKQAITEVSEMDLMYLGLREGHAEQAFANMAGAMYAFYDASGQRSKAAFALFKAFSIAQTIAATYVAATAALEPPPIGAGPLFGPILAATTIAAGLANVASILSTNIGSGGGGGGRSSAPSIPSGITNNNNNQRNVSYVITINSEGDFEGDKDKFARELIYYIDKARGDGG